MRLSLQRNKGHFLLYEHGDLPIFLDNFGEIIILFELKELKNISSSAKKVIEKNVFKLAIRGCKVVILRSSAHGTF